MNKFDKYRELDEALTRLNEKIRKVQTIIACQQEGMTTQQIDQYREKYLRQMHARRKMLTDEQIAIADQVSFNEALAYLRLNTS